MTRVLLTGAGGFVGHHFLEHALENTDWEIVCIDSFRHRGKTDRIREVLDGRPDDAERVHVLTHDLRAPISAQLDHEIGYVNYVISMASDSHVDRSCVEPRPFIENNVSLVLTLLEWMRERWRFDPVQKFLHVSTDEVYGPAEPGHDHQEGEPHRPSNPYSASKACQEDIVYSYWRTYGLPVAVSNTMNIIGERQDPEKFVPLVLARVLAGAAVPIHASSEGQPGSRFYLHARNQADALKFLLETEPFPRYGETKHRDRVDCLLSRGLVAPDSLAADSALPCDCPTEMGRYNVVGERELDNLELAAMVAGFAGRELVYDLVDFHSSRPGHDLRYSLDGSKMSRLGWTPPLPLAESLQRTVEWTLQNRRWLLADAKAAV